MIPLWGDEKVGQILIFEILVNWGRLFRHHREGYTFIIFDENGAILAFGYPIQGTFWPKMAQKGSFWAFLAPGPRRILPDSRQKLATVGRGQKSLGVNVLNSLGAKLRP